MKIQCDVCDKDEASLFCVADEAALCTACDHRVHHANKLAGKHQRFSLLQPSTKQAPLCDICQDRRAFLFCQEDRAILCRECDIPIHKANEHTQKHNRYLLTGVKLSATSSLYSLSSSSSSSSSAAAGNPMNNNINVVYGGGGGVPNLQSKKSTNKPISKNPNGPRNVSKAATAGIPSTTNDNVKYASSTGQMTSGVLVGGGGGGSNINNVPTSSSISEYLIEMLPGWHVEDFLDPSSPPPFGFCKSTTSAAADNDMSMIPLWDGNDDLESNLSCFSSDSTGASWVPQSAPPFLHPTQQIQIQSFSKSDMVFGGQIISSKGSNIKDLSNIRKWTDDNSFAVPQINNPSPPPSIAASKRCRTLS